jgi:hypothetical protein
MNMRDMTRKRPRRYDSTKSSSFGEMVPSKPPKDVLELGQHLIRELAIEDEHGFDTLRRWMAHHLAELINRAENGSPVAERIKARKIATDTILKVWKHRASLPGQAYPLAPYKGVLKVLDVLRPIDKSSRYPRPHSEEKTDQLTVELFDDFSRLIIALLLMKASPRGKTTLTHTVAIKSLSKAEQQVLKTLAAWYDLFLPTTKSSPRTRKDTKNGAATIVNLNEVALGLIDEIAKTLGELRGKFQDVGQMQK